jgi:hypothetical protein
LWNKQRDCIVKVIIFCTTSGFWQNGIVFLLYTLLEKPSTFVDKLNPVLFDDESIDDLWAKRNINADLSTKKPKQKTAVVY